MTNGKQKGVRAEREICAKLQDWWRQVEPDCTFTRTPGSGGWNKGEARGEFGTSADIVTTAKHFPFAVEVKHREGWSIDNLLNGKKSPAWKWWDQAVLQAKEMNKIPMLCMKQNRQPWFVALPDEYSSLICLIPGDVVEIGKDADPVLICSLDKVLSERPHYWIGAGI